MDFVGTWLIETFRMAEAMAPWLLFGFAMSGLLHSFLPGGWIQRHLAQDGPAGVIKAALVGTPLPICSCGVIPVAKWIRKEGASRGSTMSFLVSTPETGVDSILATLALMGPLFAGIRPLVAMISGVTVGLLVGTDKSKTLAQPNSPSSCEDGCCGPTAEGEIPSQLRVKAKTFSGRLREAVEYGFSELVADVTQWLLIGLLVGGAISAFVPIGFLNGIGTLGLVGSYIAVLLLGVPLYVCATGSIPIAAALVAKGVSPGAALVFLIVGPATNVATIAFVGGSFGKRVLAIYLGGISLIAVAAGVLLDVFAPAISLGHAHHQHGSEGSWAWVSTLSAVALMLLMFPHIWTKLKKILQTKKEPLVAETILNIPSISCGNCARHIEKIGKSVPGVELVRVDVANKTAYITGTFDDATLRLKLAEDGYPPL
jgi:uncharacterized membrane protein YraQ (UPF0718 family)/copper chaperone CopZ